MEIINLETNHSMTATIFDNLKFLFFLSERTKGARIFVFLNFEGRIFQTPFT